ncbi:MAG: glycerophosphodiester phosphodiesterase [Oscillospiraceae bacterium]|jgi:glycerophosphoryl diester phosphodiesterase|nr:glycerophosphodiester phosphodiesterase [Oscillospiraceae bacterium]
MRSRPQVFAHRGDSAHAPENTLIAFERAISCGADGIELDVRRSKDGHVVISHDATVGRRSNGSGKIGDMTLDKLRELDFSRGFSLNKPARIATLEETLDIVRSSRMHINIELKSKRPLDMGLVPAVLGIVSEFGMAERVVYSSFRLNLLGAIRSASGDARIGILVGVGRRVPWEAAKLLRAEAVHVPASRLRYKAFIERCQTAKLLISVWTLDDAGRIIQAAKSGAASIITNDPEKTLAVLNNYIEINKGLIRN